MNRRSVDRPAMHRHGAVVASLLLAGLWASAAGAQETDPRPNIVICVADDQGYRDVGYMGHPHVRTPVLDEMAARGVRFDRFYAAAPVCTPTRGSLLTGRHPNRFGAFKWGHTIRPQERTLAEALKAAGYRTGHFGKWHLGPMVAGEPASPGSSGFDEWVSAFNFYNNDPWLSDNGTVRRFEGESSMVTMERALAFVEEAAKDEAPFLAVVAFGNPHSPHRPTEPLRKLYPDLPEGQANYLAEITGIDRAMGALRDRLRALDIERETLIWYLSDNGGQTPEANNGDLRGDKGSLWEGGLRVPAVVEWPGHLEPRTTKARANSSDVYPTLLEIAGVDPADQPTPLDGESLLPVLVGDRDHRKQPMGFWSYPRRGRPTPNHKLMPELYKEQQAGEEPTVRYKLIHTPEEDYPDAERRRGPAAWIDGDWKLHRRSGGYELYNLADDPREQKNVIDAHPDRAARMKQALETWQESVARSLKGADY